MTDEARNSKRVLSEEEARAELDEIKKIIIAPLEKITENMTPEQKVKWAMEREAQRGLTFMDIAMEFKNYIKKQRPFLEHYRLFGAVKGGETTIDKEYTQLCEEIQGFVAESFFRTLPISCEREFIYEIYIQYHDIYKELIQ